MEFSTYNLRVYIVIPFHNEEDTLSLTLTSLINQTKKPDQMVLVNDNSSDRSLEIASSFEKEHAWISVHSIHSSNEHLPGAKVINAFYKGLDQLENDFDIICKFDADIQLPNDYLQKVMYEFSSNSKAGIVGGLLYTKKNEEWIFENIASREHVRGPIKAYRKGCFDAIGGLKKVIGWDTIDTLLAQYYHWEVVTLRDLKVKHLKPTGQTYAKKAQRLSGERWYQMRYGLLLTIIASLKSAMNAGSLKLFINSIQGYFNAKRNSTAPAVTKDQGKFIRKLRRKGILKKLFG